MSESPIVIFYLAELTDPERQCIVCDAETVGCTKDQVCQKRVVQKEGHTD